MLNAIIHFSVRNKLIIGLFTLAWIIWGVIELFRLPVDALPDITSNQVQVITVSPTLGSLEVERLITFPIEQASSNIPGIKEIRSISRFGLSVVTIVFDDSRDVYWCRQQVTERMTQIRDEIPKEAGSPELAPVTTGLGEIYQYVVRAKKGYEQKYDLTELRTIQDWIIRRQLLGTPGVADVSSFGGRLKQYEVAIDPVNMRGVGVTLQDIYQALETNNQNSGAAYIEKGPALLFVRTEGLAKTIGDIENIYVKHSASGTPIYIKDVAEVRIGSPTRYGALTYGDQGEVSGAVVLMLKGANASEVIGNIEKRMEKIKRSLPEGVEVEVFLNRTKMVDRTLSTVTRNLLEGALIVLFILVFFLGNIRAGLIVASVIPLAMLFAVGMMNLFGVSGNLMSLGALDFGLIVDGAVIIVEAVLHRLHSNKNEGLLLRQFQMDDTVEKSAGRMMGAAVFGQIIILVVYIPIFSLTGIEGKMFKPMAQTVAFALIGAFILSLTYIPMMTSIVLSKKLSNKDNFSDRMINALQEHFKSALSKIIAHPKKVVSASILLLVISSYIASTLGGEFIPELEEGDFAIDARLMTGSTLKATIDATTEAVHEIKKFPEVEKVVTRIGASEIPTDPMPIEMTDIIVNLKDKSEWTSAETYDELANKMSSAITKVPGLTGGFQYPVQMRFNELIAGAKQDVVCKIFGENLDTLAHYASQFEEVIHGVEGAKDVFAERVTGLPQVIIRYRKNSIAAYGFSVADVNRALRASFAGETAGQIYENERRFDLVVRLKEDRRKELADIKGLLITNSNGFSVPLEQLADISIEEGPNQVQREDAKRRITIAFNVRDRDVQSVVEEVQEKVAKKIQLPAGYFVHYGGQFENLTEAKDRLMIAVPIALLLILLILYFSFGSMRYGLLIYTAIPLSAIGGILLLWIRDMPFSISAGVGFIALFGVAVLNGIVLINEFNRLRVETKLDMKDIVLKGTSTRLRPVLMTAAVASLGFLPMALSTSSGAEVQRPLATVVIGGLISATLLTLFVLPVLYVWVENRKMNREAGKATLMILLLISLSVSSSAQSVPAMSLSMDSILRLADKQAYTLAIADKQVNYAEVLRKKPYEISKTGVSFEYGKVNSAFNDSRVLVSQSFQFPQVYARQASAYQSALEVVSAQKTLKKADIHLLVRQLCYRIMDLDRRAVIINELEKNFREWVRIAELQQGAGEISESILSSVKIQFAENSLQENRIDTDKAALVQELALLIRSSQPIAPEFKNTFTIPMLGQEGIVESHPSMQLAEALINERKSMTMLERNRLSPDLTAGYSNMSIVGWQTPDGVAQKYYGPSSRFGVYQLGVGLPIFNGASRAKVKASKIGEEIAQIHKQQLFDQLSTQYLQLKERYLHYINAYNYYEKEGLVLAKKMISQATTRLTSGDIPYAEWALMVSQSLHIYISHAESLHALQMLEAEFIYLTEKK
ncbi:MAG: CusA/CzcA family heavy metal efflux RND transporter [bacterium]